MTQSSLEIIRVHVVESSDYRFDVRGRREAGRVAAEMQEALPFRLFTVGHRHTVTGGDDERWGEPAPQGRRRTDRLVRGGTASYHRLEGGERWKSSAMSIWEKADG